jgi:hypothetical protein
MFSSLHTLYTYYVHITGYIQTHVLRVWFKGFSRVILSTCDSEFKRRL